MSKELNITILDSSNFLEKFLLEIKKNVYSKDIKISKFGTFYIHKTPRRVGRNPKSKESYIIQPSEKVNFKSSSLIKEILN